MQFEVDPRSPVSPSEQLADQVRFAVAAGRLDEGERLPSVRELARAVCVNPNTVGRAWRELEREGVTEARRGTGVFVAAGASALCRAARARLVTERLGRAVIEALSAGLPSEEIHRLVEGACRAPEGEPAGETEELSWKR